MIKFVNSVRCYQLLIICGMLLLPFVGLHAQSIDSVSERPKAKIVLEGKAKIYSTDGAFNKQISTGRIIQKETNVVYHENGSGINTMEVTSAKSRSSQSKLKKQRVKKVTPNTKDSSVKSNRKKDNRS